MSINTSLSFSKSFPFSSRMRQIVEFDQLKAQRHFPVFYWKNEERRFLFLYFRLTVHPQFLRTIILLLRKFENQTQLQTQYNTASINILILLNNFINPMNIGAGDYYSVSNKGYIKHPNVQIIGIENYPSLGKSLPPSSATTDQQFQDKSIIKQEELEYDLPQSRIVQEMPRMQSYNQARKIMEKEEVSSVHLTTPKCSNEPQNLTHSCIANGHTTQYKGILKRSLHQLHKKNINSQEDIHSDKDLYLQLEKERRLRRQLEKSYKGLLSEMQRKERTYSVQLNGEEREDEGRRRQFSKRTLNEEKSSEGVISYQELAPSKSRKQTDFKTVRLKQPQKCNNIQSQEEKQEDNHEQCQSQDSNDYRKEAMTEQSAEQQSDYFKDQRDFQHRVISQMRDLNKRITQIDQFLLEREKEHEKERLNQIIQEKERQIKRIELENQQLRARKHEPDNSQGIELDLLKKLSPTSVYFMLILIMAIVAMS